MWFAEYGLWGSKSGSNHQKCDAIAMLWESYERGLVVENKFIMVNNWFFGKPKIQSETNRYHLIRNMFDL